MFYDNKASVWVNKRIDHNTLPFMATGKQGNLIKFLTQMEITEIITVVNKS